jgi:hypothetical protein
MAERPFKVTDRRGVQSSYWDASFSEPVARRFDGQRRQIDNFNKDASSLTGPYSRSVLMSMGRYLFQNVTPLRNALSEMGLFASSGIQIQFDGEDAEWGRTAEAWLYSHDWICDVRGTPYSMQSLRELLVLSYLRDGDSFVLLTESESGFPMFQHIPGHRVGSRGLSIVPAGSQYAGMMFRDGAIINEQGRPIAYRLLADDPKGDRDVDVRSLVPCFIPEYADQYRGTSPLAASILDFMDVSEARRLEMVSQKVFSGLSLLVHNETGGPAETANLVSRYGSGGLTSTGATNTDAVKLSSDEIVPGEIRYVRAGSQSKVEAITGDRPSMNQRAFTEEVLRQAISGFGWSYDFSQNPTKAGGAQMRVVVEKINKRLAYLRDRLLYPTLRRLDGYRVAKAQKLGLLPSSDEWMRWEYISPAQVTADRKYDSDVAIAEFRAGFRTMADVCARNGEWAEDVLKRRKRETSDLLKAAAELAKEHGIDMSIAITLLRDTTSYSTTTNSAAAIAESQAATNESQ